MMQMLLNFEEISAICSSSIKIFIIILHSYDDFMGSAKNVINESADVEDSYNMMVSRMSIVAVFFSILIFVSLSVLNQIHQFIREHNSLGLCFTSVFWH